MEIKTRNFGTIRYEEPEVVYFPGGLIGLEHLKRFVVLAYENYQPLKFLQSVEMPEFSFILVNPYLLDPSYQFHMSPADTEEIGLAENGGVLLYIIMTLPMDVAKISVNFLAPIVINSVNMRARQVVMSGTDYSVTQPVVLDPSLLNSEK